MILKFQRTIREANSAVITIPSDFINNKQIKIGKKYNFTIDTKEV